MIIYAHRELLILYESKGYFCLSSFQSYILRLKSANISYKFGAYPEGVAMRMAFLTPEATDIESLPHLIQMM